MDQLNTVILYVFAGAAAIVAGLQVGAWLAARRLVGRPAPDLSDLPGFDAPATGRRVYYFFSPRCLACREMTPRVERLSTEHPEIVKIDILRSREAARRFRVTATPTTVVVENGMIVTALIGPQHDRRLRALLRPA